MSVVNWWSKSLSKTIHMKGILYTESQKHIRTMLFMQISATQPRQKYDRLKCIMNSFYFSTYILIPKHLMDMSEPSKKVKDHIAPLESCNGSLTSDNQEMNDTY